MSWNNSEETEKLRKSRQKESIKKKHEKWVNDLISRISKEELEEYFNLHRNKDVCEHFNISNNALGFLIKYYNINKKSKQNIMSFRIETNLDKYGCEHSLQSDEIKEKSKATCLKKYGVEYSFQSNNNKEKSKTTCLEKYGVDHPVKSKEIQDKIKSTYIKNFGSISNAYDHIDKKSKQTRINNEGSLYNSYHNAILKQSNTIKEKYGYEWACLRPEARNFSNDSKPNLTFAKLLDSNNISYEREFVINRFAYDFKVDNVLIEIDPSTTHNSTFGVFKNDAKDKNYHYNKSKLAEENGFRCIHVWDWDSNEKILSLISKKDNIYARKCSLKEVSKKECDTFLNKYHLQGTCRSQKIRLGLYYNSELIQIMTFGKPRYNKNYQYELLRLCTKENYKVIGGSSKLFKNFIRIYNPQSIISYCDKNKFSGNVYQSLGFELLKIKPSKHWYNMKTNQHITDNLLRNRGYDQLFNTNYGKGSSNEELMINNNFVEIYDAGQASYIYTKEI